MCPFMASIGYQPRLFPVQQEEVAVPFVQALILSVLEGGAFCSAPFSGMQQAFGGQTLYPLHPTTYLVVFT